VLNEKLEVVDQRQRLHVHCVTWNSKSEDPLHGWIIEAEVWNV